MIYSECHHQRVLNWEDLLCISKGLLGSYVQGEMLRGGLESLLGERLATLRWSQAVRFSSFRGWHDLSKIPLYNNNCSDKHI